MIVNISKKKIKHLRKKARTPANLRFRDSKVGSECLQCNLPMTKSSPAGEDFSSVTIEHIVPLDPRYGGDSRSSNLEIICFSCNNGRNQYKKKNDDLGIILPDLFWWSSIYHNNHFCKKILLEFFPHEWDDLKNFLPRMK